MAFIPYDVFHSFDRNRYPRLRQFIGEITTRLAGKLPIRVSAPTCVDAVLRKNGPRTLVHLINRGSGLPNVPSSGAIDEIPPVGPVTVEMDLPEAPNEVSLAFEEAPLAWEYTPGKRAGRLKIRLERVHIHAAVVVS